MFDSLRPKVARPVALATTNPEPYRGVTVNGVPLGVRTAPQSSAPGTDLEACTVPAYLRGLSWIGTQVSSLPLHVLDGRDKVDPQPLVVARPDPRFSQRDFLGQLAVSLASHGNAFAVLHGHDDYGIPAIQACVHPSRVTFNPQTGLYMIGTVGFDPSVMMHLRMTTLPGDLFALSPLDRCRLALGYSKALQDHAARWLSDNATPSGIIAVSRKEFTTVQARELKDQWLDMAQGSREPIVLPGDHSWTTVAQASPENMELLESRRFAMVDVANMLGISVHRLNGTTGDSATYVNEEVAAIRSLNEDLAGYIAAIEDGFTDLVSPLGLEAKFNLDARLRPDTKTRYEAHAIALGSGFLTKNEVRDLEDLPPLEEGNTEDE